MQEREDWQLELANSTRTIDELERLIPIQNREKLLEVISGMRFSITPHQRTLIDFSDPNDPLLRMCIPHEQELFVSEQELIDPIGDEVHMTVPFLTHRYENRVLIHATFNCAAYCRFCFRKHKTGQANPGPTAEERARIFDYLRDHAEIEEAILSGGDPLTLTDDLVSEWISELSKIPSIKRVRIHTRTLVNLPSRFTDSLIQILSDAKKPISIVTHFNHPREIAPENVRVITKLINAGITISNQNVLLRGVNDNVEVLNMLFKALVEAGATPYYMHQLDLAKGTNHFRVPLEQGMELIKKLRSQSPDLPLPRYMLDLPGGHGKIEITSNNIKKQGDHWIAKSPFGHTIEYNEPKISNLQFKTNI